MSNSSDLGTNTSGSSSPYGGYMTNYSALDYGVQQGEISVPYQGYDCTYGGAVTQNINNGAGDQQYNGLMSSGGTNVDTRQLAQSDNAVAYPYPKDQQIYYKLRGFNSNTSSYETWIIVEEIVPRPEVFDPTRSPPNIDLDVFFSPPSGNTLSNIRIVGRWIQ